MEGPNQFLIKHLKPKIFIFYNRIFKMNASAIFILLILFSIALYLVQHTQFVCQHIKN